MAESGHKSAGDVTKDTHYLPFRMSYIEHVLLEFCSNYVAL